MLLGSVARGNVLCCGGLRGGVLRGSVFFWMRVVWRGDVL